MRVLAVDIAGAFDEVSHGGLLREAEALGISGELLQRIRSYRSDRKLQAVVGGHILLPRGIDAGVPQGSILWPILFLLLCERLRGSPAARGGTCNLCRRDSDLQSTESWRLCRCELR